MDERFDVYRGGECVKRGASLREAAELLGIEMIELATTVLEYDSCMIGEFRAVPSKDPASPS
jgi:uncharacterized protein with GYD domain